MKTIKRAHLGSKPKRSSHVALLSLAALLAMPGFLVNVIDLSTDVIRSSFVQSNEYDKIGIMFMLHYPYVILCGVIFYIISIGFRRPGIAYYSLGVLLLAVVLIGLILLVVLTLLGAS